ncbi:TetR/AcrR family transcriptional regulator [Nocardia pseudobrasiliensis]|uniref:TetR family transcriptional regulator n=1 Tax=Nocardia pseudobrasiliensis TaxID=45979 RepID=A0A370IF47_9NOCA|nr:TetR/AcrR family transcriptional regulator [Nocardia pseudobrasiliensis]RDI68074.1 TetR family transcriptional regulator [Nocardia pseudobrasiliensis]
MSEAAPNRHDRRRARTRRRILTAADEVLAAHGESGTIERIAEVADVAVATIYQHFAGKDDIYLALVDEALERNERHMMAAYHGPRRPVERLIDAAEAYLLFYLESPRQFAMIEFAGGSQSDRGTPRAREMITERVALMNSALESVLADGVAAGEFRPLPPVAGARFLWGALNGVFALSARPDGLRAEPELMRESLYVGMELILEGAATDRLRDADGRVQPALLARLREAVSVTPAERQAG